MFNFKKIKEAVTKLTSIVLTATLSVGIFSAIPIKAMEGFNDCDYDYLEEIVMIGDTQSGKTQIINRMVESKFDDNYMKTIGLDFKSMINSYKGRKIKLNIWDISGQEKYIYITSNYYRSVKAVILTVAYDNDDWQKSIINWMKLANRNVDKTTPVKVVITKSDIDEKDRKFTNEKVEEYLKNNIFCKKLIIDTKVIETSAKNNTGIKHKESEERNPETCLEDYLLDLLEIPEQTPEQIQDNPKQIQYNQKQQEYKSTFEKAFGVMTKHPVISIGALATVFVLTPILIFKNKIINGVKNIFGKNQNKKPVAKRIKATN